MLIAYNCIKIAYEESGMIRLTPNKAGLLRLFFTNPDKSFYIQQIGRLLGKKPGVFQKTLNGLEKQGVLTSEYVANMRYFTVNKDYPLYEEFKRIIFKTVGVAGSIKDVLEKLGDIALAFVYGSYAKGKENILSDIDLIIVGRPNEDLLIKQLDAIEDKLSRQINYKLYSPAEFAAYTRKKDPFLTAIMKEKRIVLLGEGNDFRKVRSGKSRKEAAT
jgi:predicted nucleotidyltransferase